ncbi:hypothetical protein PHYPSEUDO_010856 [Phytophthora pseudosyringae]|uniref:Uncharacterized protein n=1 Tax=Phytophthora pseudosyringae TaxID=221518 RepID=A0A8T1V9C7_9STRA|nr:hypothetical protein PHYPSEUDO_010856 [Phytophthora pseudosyringae]
MTVLEEVEIVPDQLIGTLHVQDLLEEVALGLKMSLTLSESFITIQDRPIALAGELDHLNRSEVKVLTKTPTSSELSVNSRQLLLCPLELPSDRVSSSAQHIMIRPEIAKLVIRLVENLFSASVLALGRT